MGRKSKAESLTPTQRNAIMFSLKAFLVANEQTGKFKYFDGYSDASIAEKHSVGEAQVRAIRVNFFGNLEPNAPFIKYGELVDRLFALEKQVAELTERFSPHKARLSDPAHSALGDDNARQRVVNGNGSRSDSGYM